MGMKTDLSRYGKNAGSGCQVGYRVPRRIFERKREKARGR
jgi:hypothetical protein